MRYRTMWQYLHIDIFLFSFLLLLSIAGLFILYSASGNNVAIFAYRYFFIFISFIA